MQSIKLKKGQDRRINAGHPWVYSNEIEPIGLTEIASGSLVKIMNNFGNFLAIGYYNRHSLIAARVLSKNENQEINKDFFVQKISTALKLREDFFPQPYYRLIHSEADGLPGIIIDRFDNLWVAQITTAGMENLLPLIIESLNQIFSQKKY